MLKVKKKNAQAWEDARKKCRLNADDIQMAKELGMTPNSLFKNIPTQNQQWKAPVKDWIRELYEEKFNNIITTHPAPSEKVKTKSQKLQKSIISESWIDDEDLPF